MVNSLFIDGLSGVKCLNKNREKILLETNNEEEVYPIVIEISKKENEDIKLSEKVAAVKIPVVSKVKNELVKKELHRPRIPSIDEKVNVSVSKKTVELGKLRGIPGIGYVAGIVSVRIRSYVPVKIQPIQTLISVPKVICRLSLKPIIVRLPHTPSYLVSVHVLTHTLLKERRLARIPFLTAQRISSSLPSMLVSSIPIIKKCSVRYTLKTIEEADKVLQWSRVEGLTLLDILGEEFKKGMAGILSSYIGEPVIIIAQIPPEWKKASEGRIWYLLWILCREIYREVRGELLDCIDLSTADIRGTLFWLRLYGRLAGKLVIVRSHYLENKQVRELFKQRLHEAFSQGLGFLVILADDVDNTETIVNNLSAPYEPKIVAIRVDNIEDLSAKISKYLSAVFGLRAPLNDLEMIASIYDRGYKDLIHELLGEAKYLDILKRDISDRESEDHMALKVLAIKYLEKQGIPLNNVKVTEQIGENIVADIYVTTPNGKGIAIEVETLYGAGPVPLLKIIDTCRKYLERKVIKQVNELWIIVPNWATVIHLDKLLYIKTIIGKKLKENGITIRIFTPNIVDKTLTEINYLAGFPLQQYANPYNLKR